MKKFLFLLPFLFVCSSQLLPPKQCGEAGYSHFVNFPEVERAAEMCHLAYEPDSVIRERYEQENRVYIKMIKETDIKYYIIYEDMRNRQHVVIRGTASFDNVKTDGKYKKVKNEKLTKFESDMIDQSVEKDEKLEIYVHRGFNKAGKSVYNDIMKNALLEKRYLTTVQGHSLGGAAALILYLCLYADSVNLGMLYTFGQPKALTTDGVLKFRCIPCIRFVNENDMVPCVPPSKFALGLFTSIPLWRHGLYRHLGDEVILLKDSNYVYLEYHDAERLNVTSFWNRLGKGELSIHDHMMPQYLKNLEIKKSVITEQDFKDQDKYKHK